MNNTSFGILKTVDKSAFDTETPEPSESELQGIAQQIEAPVTIDIRKSIKRQTLGRLMAKHNISDVTGAGIVNQEIIEQCIKRCLELFEINKDVSPEIAIKAMTVVNSLLNTSVQWALIQIKLSEILMSNEKRNNIRKKAPQFNIENINIQNNIVKKEEPPNK